MLALSALDGLTPQLHDVLFLSNVVQIESTAMPEVYEFCRSQSREITSNMGLMMKCVIRREGDDIPIIS